MALYRTAQTLETLEVNDLKDLGHEDEIILYEDKPSEDEVLELHAPQELEITFKLPDLPGSDAPLEVSTDDDIEVEEKGKDKNDADLEVMDPWETNKILPENAVMWAKERLAAIPRHSGREILGLERAIAYLKRVDSEMSKMIARDFGGKIDLGQFETIRREIYNALARLEKAKEGLYKQYKQSADDKAGLVKEAKQDRIGGHIITVPLIISLVARTCANSMISGGHDIEDVFRRQVKEYDLTKREVAEALQHLQDLGYFIRRDRLFPPGSKEQWDISDGKGDFASQYYS